MLTLEDQAHTRTHKPTCSVSVVQILDCDEVIDVGEIKHTHIYNTQVPGYYMPRPLFLPADNLKLTPGSSGQFSTVT